MRNRTCPICGEPSMAKVACLECRRSHRLQLKCEMCGVDVRRGARGSQGRLCSACRWRSKPLEQCRQCDRMMRLVARGLCGSCQSRDHRNRNGRKTYPGVCAFCATDFAGSRPQTRFCSLYCAKRAEAGWSRSKDVVLSPPVAKARPTWQGHVVPSSQGFSAGCCEECGERFVREGRTSYCSARCRDRASNRRQRLARGRFVVSDRVRLAIYERDGWVCQLCETPVDVGLPVEHALSATLDHVVPQSHQLVPDHSPSNLRLAHRICNSLRGDGLREVDYGSRVEALRNVGRVPAASS